MIYANDPIPGITHFERDDLNRKRCIRRISRPARTGLEAQPRVGTGWRTWRSRLRADDGNARRKKAVVAWLKATREEIGLQSLAQTLSVDAANLGKVIEGGGNISKALRVTINNLRLDSQRNEK